MNEPQTIGEWIEQYKNAELRDPDEAAEILEMLMQIMDDLEIEMGKAWKQATIQDLLDQRL